MRAAGHLALQAFVGFLQGLLRPAPLQQFLLCHPEQPSVLEGDRRLIRQQQEQFGLFLPEGVGFLIGRVEHPDHAQPDLERHACQRPRPASRVPRVVWIGADVGKQDHLPRPGHGVGRALTAGLGGCGRGGHATAARGRQRQPVVGIDEDVRVEQVGQQFEGRVDDGVQHALDLQTLRQAQAYPVE